MISAISDRVKKVQVDRAQGNALRIVPICGPSSYEPRYGLLSVDHLAFVHVTEISEAGSVPELRVENTLDMLVYLMDGQELVGAKQNRILNTDVLVPAKSTLTIPVSCVEQGRWRSISPQFSSGKASPSFARAAKSARVHESLKSSGHHDANQGAVWDEVCFSLERTGTSSPTSAMNDAFAQREGDLRNFRQQLSMPEDAVGLAVFHGDEFKGMDLFDRHSTLQFFWESLVDSYALDWLGAQVEPPAKKPGDTKSTKIINRILQDMAKGKWEPFASPGAGRDFRLTSRSFTGSALVWEDSVVLHLQVFPKQPGRGGQPTARPRIHRPYGRGPEIVY